MAGRGKERLVQVEIYGQRYTLKGTEDEGYMESLGSHVDRDRAVIRRHGI